MRHIIKTVQIYFKRKQNINELNLFKEKINYRRKKGKNPNYHIDYLNAIKKMNVLDLFKERISCRREKVRTQIITYIGYLNFMNTQNKIKIKKRTLYLVNHIDKGILLFS